jgi:hypothetical protein
MIILMMKISVYTVWKISFTQSDVYEFQLYVLSFMDSYLHVLQLGEKTTGLRHSGSADHCKKKLKILSFAPLKRLKLILTNFDLQAVLQGVEVGQRIKFNDQAFLQSFKKNCQWQ